MTTFKYTIHKTRVNEEGKNIYAGNFIGLKRADKQVWTDYFHKTYPEYEEDQIVKIWTMVQNVNQMLLKNGYIMETPTGQLTPVLKGGFDSLDDHYKQGRNHIDLSCAINEETKSALKEIKVEKVTAKAEGPILYHIEDASHPNLSKNEVTQGGFIKIIGKSLTIKDNNHGATDQGVYISKVPNGKRIKCRLVLDNRDSCLIVQLPQELPPGKYIIEVWTYSFSRRCTQTLRRGTLSTSIQIVAAEPQNFSE